MNKLFIAALLMTTVAFAGDDLYRKMEITWVTDECAMELTDSLHIKGMGSSLIEYSPHTKILCFSYVMPEKTSSADRQKIRDAIAAQMVKSCGKKYDVFETIQTGEKLTSPKDRKK